MKRIRVDMGGWEGGRWGYKRMRNEDREGEEKTCMLKTSFKRCLRASVENLGLGMGVVGGTISVKRRLYNLLNSVL